MPPTARILLVDDEPSFSRLVEMLLRRTGYEVLSVRSGEKAIPFAEEADIALVDMVMPGLDGPETIAELQWRNPRLQILATSGCDEQFFRPALDRLGIDHFLPKPFSIEELLAHLDALHHRLCVA